MNDSISYIIPHLYVSDWTSSQNSFMLKNKNIKAILTVEKTFKTNEILDYYKIEGIDFMHISIDDNPDENISSFFDQSYDFIDKHITKRENVLVHCMAGISRSVTIVLNYIIRKLSYYSINISPKEAVLNALYLVRQGRPIANPNNGFLEQLFSKAEEYYKNRDKSSLNFIYNQNNMCDNKFLDSNGKPANVICLDNRDFDSQGNLINFKDVIAVIFYYADFCGHCQHTKPEFIKFANMLGNSPARAFVVDGMKNKELISRITPGVWKYEVRGYPTIIGYNKGAFYSEYGMDNPETFRKADDFVAYARGIGSAEVQVVK